MDAYYHVQCYLRLRDAARVVERQMSSDEPPATTFDAMVMAQMVALVEESRTGTSRGIRKNTAGEGNCTTLGHNQEKQQTHLLEPS